MKKTLKEVIVSFLEASKKMNALTYKWMSLFDDGKRSYDEPVDSKLEKEYSETIDKYEKYTQKTKEIILKNSNHSSLALAKDLANILTKKNGEQYVVKVDRYKDVYTINVENMKTNVRYCIDSGLGKEKNAERNLFDTSKVVNDEKVVLVCLAPKELHNALTGEKTTTGKEIQKAVDELFGLYVNEKVKEKLPDMEM